MLRFLNLCLSILNLFDVITAIYLLGREKNTRPAQCLVRETPFFHSGISTVKSGSQVLKLYGD